MTSGQPTFPHMQQLVMCLKAANTASPSTRHVCHTWLHHNQSCLKAANTASPSTRCLCHTWLHHNQSRPNQALLACPPFVSATVGYITASSSPTSCRAQTENGQVPVRFQGNDMYLSCNTGSWDSSVVKCRTRDPNTGFQSSQNFLLQGNFLC